MLRILEFEGSDLGKPSPVALASPSFCARPEGSACAQIKGPSVLVITLAHVYLFFTAIGGGHREARKEAVLWWLAAASTSSGGEVLSKPISESQIVALLILLRAKVGAPS